MNLPREFVAMPDRCPQIIWHYDEIIANGVVHACRSSRLRRGRCRERSCVSCRLRETYDGPSKAVDMPDRGGYWGPGLNNPFCSTWPRQGRSSARWSRRAMIPLPLLRHAVVFTLAALAIIWPGMVSAWAQAQPREGFARTSPPGSYLGRSARRWSARRRGGGVLLPRRAR